MKNKFNIKKPIFIESARELKSVTKLSVSGMLLALRVVLGIFTVLVIPEVKIGFSFLPTAISGLLYGPFVSGLVGGLGDIFSYIFNPVGGAYFPGFTISCIATGIIYGCFFYKRTPSLIRVIVCELLIAVFVELALTSLWVTILYGKAFFVVLVARLVKVAVMLPVKIIFNYFSAKLVLKIATLRTKQCV